ncbi:MAG TPA: glycerol-3-phosphate dehydrogenase [Pyrinomonadaceae bacterium]
MSNLDLIIIGAGINGAGIARDAAMRGLKVLILDKGDIGGGTSSYSTRLIHGGLRYLEFGELGLVRESLRERETLLHIAPHLVRPIPILIPIYKGAQRGRTKIRAGMIAYDLLSPGKSEPRHQMFSRQETLARSSGLESKDLVGGAIYYDCQVEFAERLVLENILSAREHGAQVLTYARVTRIDEQHVEFVYNDKTETVTADLVINAAGPWIDQVLQKSAAADERLIGGTKGTHIALRSFPGAPATAIYLEARSDQRPFFVIPWNNNYLIGTTDDRFEGDLDQVHGELREVDYLLKETNKAFPEANLTRTDVCFTYSGVRPLPFTANTKESGITRRHFIREHTQNKHLLSIVGGKLTTYRSLAEECVDLVFKKLGRQSPRCRTGEVELPGSLSPPNVRHASASLDDRVNHRLARIYGSRVKDLLALCVTEPTLAETFNKDRDAIAAEIVFAFQAELATTLTDCMLRRTMIGLNADLGLNDIDAAAEIGKSYLGWTDKQAVGAITEYKNHFSASLRPSASLC